MMVQTLVDRAENDTQLLLPTEDAGEHPTKPGFLSWSWSHAGVVYSPMPGGTTAQQMKSS